MTNRFYTLTKAKDSAELYIYGDIGDFGTGEGMSARALADELRSLGPVETISVHINSYGGDAADGLAIYNALRRSPATVTTTCDGMACSAASVVFMAGDVRTMCEASLLMVHNAWAFGEGNADQLRKQADDLEAITDATKQAYLSRVSIDERQLTKLMDAETWLTPAEAVEMGFATDVDAFVDVKRPSQSARRTVFARVAVAKGAGKSEDEPEAEPDKGDEPEPDETETAPGPEGDPEDPDEDDGGEGPADTARQMVARFFDAIL